MSRIGLMALTALSLAVAGCTEKSESSKAGDKPVYSIPVPLA